MLIEILINFQYETWQSNGVHFKNFDRYYNYFSLNNVSFRKKSMMVVLPTINLSIFKMVNNLSIPVILFYFIMAPILFSVYQIEELEEPIIKIKIIGNQWY